MSIYQSFKNLIRRICSRIYEIGYNNYFLKNSKQSFSKLHYDGEGIVNIPEPYYFVGAEYMTIGCGFSTKPGLRMECIDEYSGQHFNPQLSIGKNVSFNFFCHVGCINSISIGDDVMIGSYVLITDHSHGELNRSDIPVAQRLLLSKGPVVIEDNVWIGEHACILPGVTIGRGSIVGANAVVTHDVPPFSLVVGVPAKVIKTL